MGATDSLLRRTPLPRRLLLLVSSLAASTIVLAAPAATAILAEPIEGEWDAGSLVIRVDPLGPQEFQGVIVVTTHRCWPAGEVYWRMRGRGVTYTGTQQWKNLETCRGQLGETTWTVEGATLRVRATHPQDGTVSVRTFTRRTGPREVALVDASEPEPPPSTPVATANPADPGVVARTATAVTGNGTIVEVGRGAMVAGAAGRIACGFNRYSCYTQLEPGTRVLLRAQPQPGHVFRGWTGACAGQSATCVLVARELQSVAALFAPRVPAATVGLDVDRPGIRIRWSRSVGSGRVTVSGRVGGAASLRLQVRRPGGGPLLTRRLAVRGGPFRRQLPLRRGALARGAHVFPGGLVVSVTGSSASSPLGLYLRTLVVPAPAEGVVRRAFASAIANGPATPRLPATATEAWARFQFATQPSTRLPLTVSWYWPDGTLLGTADKANRPEVASRIRSTSGAPIPRGLWVAELRAGTRVVKRLSVRVG